MKDQVSDEEVYWKSVHYSSMITVQGVHKMQWQTVTHDGTFVESWSWSMVNSEVWQPVYLNRSQHYLAISMHCVHTHAIYSACFFQCYFWHPVCDNCLAKLCCCVPFCSPLWPTYCFTIIVIHRLRKKCDYGTCSTITWTTRVQLQ